MPWRSAIGGPHAFLGEIVRKKVKFCKVLINFKFSHVLNLLREIFSQSRASVGVGGLRGVLPPLFLFAQSLHVF